MLGRPTISNSGRRREVARGSTQAQEAGKSAQGFATGLQGNAASLYGSLTPQLLSEATHPAGMAPTDLAAINTAAQQSAGGSEAAAKGEGALLAGRTRNAGTGAAAIGEASRAAGRNLSQRAVETQGENALLKAKQKQSALSGLEGLTGIETEGANRALGIVPQAVNANTNAANQSWDWAKYILDPAMQASATAAKAFV